MSDILSPEEVARLRSGNTNPRMAAALISHETLRARLAEATELLLALLDCHDYLGGIANASACSVTSRVQAWLEERDA